MNNTNSVVALQGFLTDDTASQDGKEGFCKGVATPQYLQPGETATGSATTDPGTGGLDCGVMIMIGDIQFNTTMNVPMIGASSMEIDSQYCGTGNDNHLGNGACFRCDWGNFYINLHSCN